MEMYENSFAKLFLADNRNQTFDTSNVNDAVLKWACSKVGAARAELIVAKARGTEPTKAMLDNQATAQYILGRVDSITQNVRQMLGLGIEQTVTVAEMSMAQYAAARKDLGVKDTHSYERSW
jgi:hypothetical protein